jgi:predicted RNase H-like nuclease (RuvC/YqgF family)
MRKCKPNLREKLVSDGREISSLTKTLEHTKDTITELESRLCELTGCRYRRLRNENQR